MPVRTDESFGVIPITREAEVWHFLLVNQIPHGKSGQEYWSFPKGHPEKGETTIETALRELTEETGVSDVRLIESATFVNQYFFTYDGNVIKKTVTYYLGVCHNTDTIISTPEEIADCRWCTAKEALEKLTHQNTKRVLTEANDYLQQHESHFT